MHNYLESIFQNFLGAGPRPPSMTFKVFFGSKILNLDSTFLNVPGGGMPWYDILHFYGKNSSKMHNLEFHFLKFSG